ncbi:hypothetical protein PSYJA_19116 [Pseudomonas syringae pv. japonica str. M301072]|uniref:Uncharacterized protein n=1 Tax=Pseudomonas syringae pv. japonica str. M301072 TaxID=629262 RepID=F3FL81_PSESX|nr:hypothetical protein PSYJA_19116 [Pseudomonas syringae pv. japonica str. M301072]
MQILMYPVCHGDNIEVMAFFLKASNYKGFGGVVIKVPLLQKAETPLLKKMDFFFRKKRT